MAIVKVSRRVVVIPNLAVAFLIDRTDAIAQQVVLILSNMPKRICLSHEVADAIVAEADFSPYTRCCTELATDEGLNFDNVARKVIQGFISFATARVDKTANITHTIKKCITHQWIRFCIIG